MMDANDFTYLDENITPYLKCGICKNPFIDPVSLSSSCQQAFCRQCIETNYETHVTNCQHCHEKSLSKEDFKSEGTVINRILNDFYVKCVRCSQENIKRENFPQHLKEICPKRIVFCSAKDVNCGWNGPYDQSDQHINTCPYEQLRSQLTELLNDKQSLVQLRNDYENLKEKSKQIEDENQMLKEDVKQMTILTQQLNDQSVENKKLEQEIILLNQQKDTLEKEFKSIQEKKNNASSELDQLNEQINRLKPFENENEQIKRENQSLQDKYEVNHLESIKCQESLQEITKQLTDQTNLQQQIQTLAEANQDLKEKYEANHLELIKCQESLQEITKQLTDQTNLQQQIATLAEANQDLREKFEELQPIKQDYQTLLQYFPTLQEENDHLKQQLIDFDRCQIDNQQLKQNQITYERQLEQNIIKIQRLEMKINKPIFQLNDKNIFDFENNYRNPNLEQFIENCQQSSLLNLNNEKLTENDMHLIISYYLITSQYQSLILWNNTLTEKSFIKFFSSLRMNNILTDLSISKNQLSDQAMKHLSEALSYHNSTLKRLILNANQITDQGFIYLSTMLKSNETILAIGLHENDITDQSMKYFCQVLRSFNKTLEEISLYSNKSITDASIDDINDMLTANQSLKVLWIDDCQFSQQGKFKLQQSTENKTDFDLKI